jgi:hypothetical protein
MENPLAMWDEILMLDTLARQEIITAPLSPVVGANVCLRDPSVVLAIVVKWNLAVECRLPNQILLSLAYVGQHGTDMMDPMPFLKSDIGLEGKRTVH